MMYRQSPSRSQRSKGIKVKHFLQLFVLLAICFWLLYQVKRSHETNKDFEKSDAIKLGRKDIQTLAEVIDESGNEVETSGEETDEHKLEERDPKLDMVKEKEEDGEEGEDDERDEHVEEKPATDFNKDEDEAQETDSDEVSREIEEASSVEEGEGTNVHEAREEHYKADDASSAVTHNMHEHTEANEDHDTAEESDEGERWKDLEVGAGETEQQNIKTNSTEGDVLENAESGSPPNATATEGSNGLFTNNSSSEIATGNEDMSSKNVTENSEARSSNVNADTDGLGTNSTVAADTELYPKNSTSATEKLHGTEVLVDQANNTNAIPETENVEIESEHSDTSDGTNQVLESTDTENPEEILHDDAIDTSDTSISSEDRDARVDLDTLPEMQTQGANNEAAAEE